MSIEAMKLALEALNSFPARHLTPFIVKARQDLRQAIQQAEEQAPWDAYDKAMAEQVQPVAIPREDSQEAAGAIQAILAEYQYPSNPTNAARAGWRAARLFIAPPPRQSLTERELELLDGMIEVQLEHANRCDDIANRPMAQKQKARDMERVELLRKLKAAHGIKEEA